MSKFDTFDGYPPYGLETAETALVTVWPSLRNFHEDLVLVGGLALKYLTRQHEGGWPGANRFRSERARPLEPMT